MQFKHFLAVISWQSELGFNVGAYKFVNKKMLKHLVYSVLLITVLSGCTATRVSEAEAAPEFLTPKGWQNPQRLLRATSFSEYAQAVTEEVKQFRVPFESATANREIEMASPAELLPHTSCGAKPAGIAILVHGLSDTAYAMHDIGTVLSNACYVSRTVLLPGHGTRSGDMLNARYIHWSDTLNYLIDQASEETDNILLVGFSLGAVLTLEKAISHKEHIDGIIALSPAYHLSSYKLAKWSGWIRPIMPWIDRGISDDAMRYEAMPTRGVVETVKAMKVLNRQLNKVESISVPWLLAQSLDDLVVLPAENQKLWSKLADHPDSRLVRFYSEEKPQSEPNIIDIAGRNEEQKVLGLSHLAIHITPDNKHYGRNGFFKNCGLTAPRDRQLVRTCEDADSVWYGLWNSDVEEGTPLAISSFNPSFDQFAAVISDFADKVAEQAK